MSSLWLIKNVGFGNAHMNITKLLYQSQETKINNMKKELIQFYNENIF